MSAERRPPTVIDGGPWRGPTTEEWVRRIANPPTEVERFLNATGLRPIMAGPLPQIGPRRAE